MRSIGHVADLMTIVKAINLAGGPSKASRPEIMDELAHLDRAAVRGALDCRIDLQPSVYMSTCAQSIAVHRMVDGAFVPLDPIAVRRAPLQG